jgi:hypothetical protein
LRHLFDEFEDVLHRALEHFLCDGVFANREMANYCKAAGVR